MLTAARGATLVLLGALVSQAAPITAQAYERDPEYYGPHTTAAAPAGTPSAEPTVLPTAEPTTGSPSETPSVDPSTTPTSTPSDPTDPTPAPDQPVAQPPAARSWSQVVSQVTATSPGDVQVRSANRIEQAESMLRCFKLDAENYCLGLGFVDEVPTGAQLESLMNPATVRADGVEQDIDTGDLTPAALVEQRSALPKSVRVTAELDEMQAAWAGREKARDLRLLAQAGSTDESTAAGHTPPDTREATPAATAGTTSAATPPSFPAPTGKPTQTLGPAPTTDPTRTTAPKPTAKPTQPTQPPAPKPKPTTQKPVAYPASAYIMQGFQTSQEKGYWCGPATFQSIDWADDDQKDTQASWAKDLGSTTGGTAISAMVRQTNAKTAWPKTAGAYVVQNVKHWNAQTFFAVHQKHIAVYKAPVIEHVQLLKRYFPYLAFNHSGHYQVGRGYDMNKGTIGIFEVFNERRFNSRGNTTNGPKNIPASAMLNATLANSFKNIGL
jgi:outer membrane biosynthesis protein TonB